PRQQCGGQEPDRLAGPQGGRRGASNQGRVAAEHVKDPTAHQVTTMPPPPARLLNRLLDRVVRPEVVLFGRRVPAFLACGYTGLALAFALAMTLVAHRGLSPAVM